MNHKSTLESLDYTKSLFHISDTFKSDFSKCGENMTEVEKHFDIKLFDHSENFIKCTYGLRKKTIENNISRGDNIFRMDNLNYFEKGKKVLIYNIEKLIYEFNTIDKIMGNCLLLSRGLQHDYPEGTKIVVIREIEYKYQPIREVLKRRIDRGRFQTLTRNVTFLSIFYHEHSKLVRYWVRVKRAEIESHVLLWDMV